jgi:hypothetical protein
MKILSRRLGSLVLVAALGAGCGSSSPSTPGQGGSTASSGGAAALGGTQNSRGGNGGTPATGGVGQGSSSGGATAQGGSTHTGGTSASGAAASAGSPASAGSTASGGSANSGGASMGGAPDASGGGAVGGPDLSVELYDPTQLPRFDIELPPASIAALNLVTGSDDPRQDVYVTGSLKYGSETVSNIGIRIKGEGSFQKLDRKPPFKLKFDEFVDKQEFRGLRRMAFNNLFEDASFIAERLAYDVYRAAGLPAPRCNSALVYVNGTFYGVYTNVEAEDKTFLKRWFPTDGGNLYEEGQVDFVPGAETKFDLETNETANDRTDLRNLIAAVQAATPATFLQDVGGLLDTAQWLKFTAVEAAVNQWDMYAYTVFYMNNFRIYNDPTSKKFAFIPWGHDMSMKPFRDSRKPYVRLFALARQGDRASGSVSSGVLFQKCLQSPACKTAYSAAVREVITTYEGLSLEATATRYYNQVKPHVAMDTRKNTCCGSPPTLTNAGFEAGYQEVLTTIRGRVAALEADLAAQ